MGEQFSRTELLLGAKAMSKLGKSRVAVFGVGGVGGFVCEALVRSGVGSFVLIDNDQVSVSNLNRQIIATRKTIGRDKVEVMKERMLDISPEADILLNKCFVLPENIDDFPFEKYDYVVDAVDTVSAKLAIITKCKQAGIPVISSMGAGNKLEASAFKVADIFKTSMCPLAKVMRHELKKRNISNLKVVYSEEKPITHSRVTDSGPEAVSAGNRRSIPGSVAFVPSAAGLIIAGEVIKDLTGTRGNF